jgi:glycosyltransferase involved in cell wall biosynthesis
MTPIPSGLNMPTNFLNRCYFIPFAVPIASKPRRAIQPLRLLVVGKYQLRKNHLLMIEAVSQLSERYRFRVTFVGEVVTPDQISIRKRVEDVVQSLGITSIVTFQDNVPYSEMGDLYGSHDVFVLPASNEPAAISVLEALGQGIPVICSDTCGTRTYIRDGVDGFVFTSNDKSSLVTILEKFLSNPDICNLMSINALKGAQNNISTNIYYARFMEMVNRLDS